MTTTQTYDFDTMIDRSNTQSAKWERYPGALALSVAEMEFPVAPPIIKALQQRTEHGFFGYTLAPDELREVIVQRMKDRYQWEVQPDHIVFNPGMVLMLNVVAQAVGRSGDGVLMDTPAYGPFLTVPGNRARFPQTVDLLRVDDDASTFHYDVDFDALEDAITGQTSLYMLCNPHNPGGKMFNRDELERLAALCLKHDIVLAADEIHCDLVMGDDEHIPIASLSPEVAQNCITMMSHTKSFSMAGMPCSVAIVPDDALRQRITQLSRASGYHISPLSYKAMLAAFRDGGDWLEAALDYIRANRAYYYQFVRDELPMLKTTLPQATYMAWLDCSALDLKDEYEGAQNFFFEEAGVALSPGTFFGKHFANYVRLNFAVPRPMLADALQRMKAAVERL